MLAISAKKARQRLATYLEPEDARSIIGLPARVHLMGGAIMRRCCSCIKGPAAITWTGCEGALVRNPNANAK